MKDRVWSDSPGFHVCVVCEVIGCNLYVAPGSPANPAPAYVTLLQAVSEGISWCRLCSGPIFRTINKYSVTTIPSTDVASELKTFVERFLLRVARSSCLAVSMPLGNVSKLRGIEELVTSDKANSSMFST